MQKIQSLLTKTAASFNNWRLARIQPSVPVLHISGDINTRTTQRITHDLNRISPKSVAIALLVNSEQGSLAQAHIILQKIITKAKTMNVPVYTFGQDACVGPGFLILTGGSKVYVDSSTVVGGTTVGVTKVDATQLFRSFGVDKTVVTPPGVHFLKSELESNSTLSVEKQEEIKAVAKQFNSQVNKQIAERRKEKFKEGGIFESNLMSGATACETGLADGLGTFNEVLSKQFGKVKIVHVMPSTVSRLLNDFNNFRLYSQIKKVVSSNTD